MNEIIFNIIKQFGGAEGFAKQFKAIYDTASTMDQQQMLVLLVQLSKATESKA